MTLSEEKKKRHMSYKIVQQTRSWHDAYIAYTVPRDVQLHTYSKHRFITIDGSLKYTPGYMEFNGLLYVYP